MFVKESVFVAVYVGVCLRDRKKEIRLRGPDSFGSMAIHSTVVKIFQAGLKRWINQPTDIDIPRATLLCSFNHTDHNTISAPRLCLWSYLSPCGHCVPVMYRVKLRQPSGAFFFAVNSFDCCSYILYVCDGQRDTDRESEKNRHG